MAIYLKIDGIDSECEKKGYEKWIEVQSWSWGAMNPSSAAFGTGLAGGTVSLQDLSVSCVTGGKVSLLLLHYLAIGKHITDVELAITKADGEASEGTWYSIKSTSAMISSYSTASSMYDDPSNPQTDQITLSLGNYTQEIWTQATDKGSLSTAGTHGFDVKTKEAT